MKRFKQIAAALLCLAAFSNPVRAEVTPEECPVKQQIEMKIDPQTYATVPERVSLSITNNSTETAQYGANYEIEKYRTDDDEWVEVRLPEGIAVIAIMYILPPGETANYDISLFPDRLEYESGTYRIKKNIFVGDGNREVYAPFTLE